MFFISHLISSCLFMNPSRWWATSTSGVWGGFSGLPLPPIANAWGALPPESLRVCGERYSYDGPTPPLLVLPNNVTMVHLLLAPQVVFITANPRPFPRTDLQFLSLSAQPPPECLRLWCLLRWYWWSLWPSLCFALLSPASVLFSEALIFSLHPGWSPCRLGGLLGCRFLSSFSAPSQERCSVLILFFFFFSLFLLSLFFSFCSTWLCGGFLALFGGLRSSARIQKMFCASRFMCRFFFFCMCLWEKVRDTSYSSATLIPLLEILCIS